MLASGPYPDQNFAYFTGEQFDPALVTAYFNEKAQQLARFNWNDGGNIDRLIAAARTGTNFLSIELTLASASGFDACSRLEVTAENDRNSRYAKQLFSIQEGETVSVATARWLAWADAKGRQFQAELGLPMYLPVPVVLAVPRAPEDVIQVDPDDFILDFSGTRLAKFSGEGLSVIT